MPEWRTCTDPCQWNFYKSVPKELNKSVEAEFYTNLCQSFMMGLCKSAHTTYVGWSRETLIWNSNCCKLHISGNNQQALHILTSWALIYIISIFANLGNNWGTSNSCMQLLDWRPSIFLTSFKPHFTTLSPGRNIIGLGCIWTWNWVLRSTYMCVFLSTYIYVFLRRIMSFLLFWLLKLQVANFEFEEKKRL